LDNQSFDSRQKKDVFLFTKMSSSGMGLTQPPSQCAIGIYFLTAKCPLIEADHVPSSCADV